MLTGELKLGPEGRRQEGSLLLRKLDLPFGTVLQVWLGDMPFAIVQNSGIITVYKNGLLEEASVKAMLVESFGAVPLLESGEASVLYIQKL